MNAPTAVHGMPDKLEQPFLEANPHLCNVTEFSIATGYTSQGVYKLIRSGKLLGVRVYTGSRSGYMWLIPRSLIPSFTERRKHPMKGIANRKGKHKS